MTRTNNIRAVFLVLGSGLFGTLTAQAADATWNLNNAGSWVTNANWLPTAAPGATTGTTNTDTATFGTIITQARTVTVDNNRNILGINFAGNSHNYTLQSGSLLLTNGGLIQTSGGGSANTSFINTTVAIQGDGGAATFTAGSSTATRLLSIQLGVTGVSTGANTTTLTLNGANTGTNLVSGLIANGAGGGNLAVVKSGAGTWRLSGANTFTGGLTLNDGILSIGNAVALGGASSVLTINGGSLSVDSARTITNNNAQNWNGDFSYVGGSTLNLGTGAVTMNANRNVSVTGGSTLTVGGVIGGAFSLTKSGANTLALTGANSFSGATVINAGTLNASIFANAGINSGIGSGSSAADLVFGGGRLIYSTSAVASTDRLFTLGNAAGLTGTIEATASSTNTLNFTGTGAIAFGGSGARTLTLDGTNTSTNTLAPILGDGSGGATTLTKTGAGQWVVSGANTYTGGTNINAGTLNLGSAGALGSSGTISFGGGTLLFTAANTTDYSARFSSAVNQAYNLTINSPQSVTLGTALTSVGGSLSKSGSGTLTLTATNSYDGGTTVLAGTLLLSGGNDRLSTTGNITVSNAGTNFDLGGNTQSTSGTVNLNRGTVLNGTLSSSGTFLAAVSGINISANLAGVAGLNVTAPSANTINLSGANNTYSGGTTLGGGALVNVSNANSLGTGAVVFNGGTLGLASGTVTLGSPNTMTASGSQNYNFDASGLLTIATNLTGATNGLSKIGTSTLALADGNTYGGVTSIGRGTVSVTSLQNGGTTSGIGNSSNAASNLLIGGNQNSNASTLQYAGTAAASTDRLFTVVLAGSPGLGGTVANSAASSAHTLTFTNTGGIAFSGTTTFAQFVLGGSNTGDNSFAPQINDGTQVTNFTKNGAGRWIVAGANTYTGVTNISAGTLSVASLANGAVASNIGQSSSAATNLLIGNAATLLYTGGAASTDRLFTINGTAAGHSATLNASGTGAVNFTNTGTLAYGTTAQTRTLILSGTNTGNNTLAATLANNGSGATSVTKNDAGTWVLSGTNTYTGATTVGGGTLMVSGTIGSTSVVAINSGTFNYTNNTTALDRAVTVAGGNFKYNSTQAYSGALTFTSGTISGTGNLSNTAVTVGAGRIMAPGNSTGSQSVGATTWANAGTFQFELNDATGTAGSLTNGWDLLNPTSLAITAGVGQFNLQLITLDNLQAAGLAQNFVDANNYSWLFVDAGATITTFNADRFAFDTSSFQNSFTGAFSVSRGTGSDDDKLYLNYTAIPEPSTYAMLGFGLLCLFGLRRMSNRNRKRD